MVNIFQSGLCPIGIDVGTHALRMVQFRASGRELGLQAACRGQQLDRTSPRAHP